MYHTILQVIVSGACCWYPVMIIQFIVTLQYHHYFHHLHFLACFSCQFPCTVCSSGSDYIPFLYVFYTFLYNHTEEKKTIAHHNHHHLHISTGKGTYRTSTNTIQSQILPSNLLTDGKKTILKQSYLLASNVQKILDIDHIHPKVPYHSYLYHLNILPHRTRCDIILHRSSSIQNQ